MENYKVIINRGVERNKKPLQNIVYKIELYKFDPLPDDYAPYMFKNEGVISLCWQYERDLNKFGSWNFHGYITPDQLKERIGAKQWQKFCEGKRQFTVQRRVDGKNVKRK